MPRTRSSRFRLPKDANGSRRTSFRIGAMIVPRVTALTASSIRRASAATALRALAPTSLFQLPGSGAEDLERMAAWIRGIPVWSLDLGSDFDRIPDLIRQAIEES